MLMGAISIYRQEVRPFTEKQIALVQNFATRPSSPSRTPGSSTSCAESLEQQTATSKVLRVISSSPGELQPVFHAMLENATRVCDAKFGTFLCSMAGFYISRRKTGTPAEFVEFMRRPAHQSGA